MSYVMTRIRFSPSEMVSPPGKGSGSAGQIWKRRKGRKTMKNLPFVKSWSSKPSDISCLDKLTA